MMLTAASSLAETARNVLPPSRPSAAEPQGCIFDLRNKLLPDAMTLIDEFAFLTDRERHGIGHIQGRTYVNLFAALERLVDVESEEALADYSPADGIAMMPEGGDSAAARQLLYRRMERMLARSMPSGYQAMADLDDLVQEKSSWGLCALALAVEFFKQAHHDDCVESERSLSPMFRNAFLRKQAGVNMQAMIAEIEWILRNADLSPDARDVAVDGFIELIEKLDRLLQAQAALDTRYFAMCCARALDRKTLSDVEAGFRKAYRWQYLFAGMAHPRFAEVLQSLVSPGQAARIKRALESLR